MVALENDPLEAAVAKGKEILKRRRAEQYAAMTPAERANYYSYCPDEMPDPETVISLDRERAINNIVKKTGATRAKVAAEYDKATAEAAAYPEPLSSAELASTEFPALSFIVAGLIREGIPQTIDGDGGIGKSSVAIAMAVARAAGVPIFGRETIQGECLFITHEDDAGDVKAMATAYTKAVGANLADLPVQWWSLPGHDITLADIDDKGKWTPGPFLVRFETKLAELPRGLFVVLDCRSDVVQMNEILREPPNTFYKTVLTPLCKKYGCTILVLCHPSKASMADGSFYSGGTGNKSALRNKLVMKLEDTSPNADPDGPRLLDVLKRNRGERRGAIRLTFDPLREIYVSDDDKLASGEPPINKYAKVVDKIRELVGRGVVVQQGNGNGQSPKDIADALKEEGVTITAKEVRSIMSRAIRDKLLGYRDRKPGDRQPAGFVLVEPSSTTTAGPGFTMSDADPEPLED